MSWLIAAHRSEPQKSKLSAADIMANRRKRMTALRSSDPIEFLQHLPELPVADDPGASQVPAAATGTSTSVFRTITKTLASSVHASRTTTERNALRKEKRIEQFARDVKLTTTVLGSGAFGVVYLGIHQRTGQYIAVKKITVRKFTAGNDQAVKNQLDDLADEIGLMKALDHQNIVKYFSAEHKDNELSIFMEYMSGGSLSSLLKKMDSNMPEPMLQVYMRQACLGVAYLHQKNIVHRDIKADNILLHSDGVAKLSDFGTSRESTDSSNLLTVTGTPWFMAPEVVKGTGHGSPADIWSLGCTIIQLLRGEAPFAEFSNPVTAMYHVAVNPTKVLEYIPQHASSSIRHLLEWCLQENAGARPTATQMLEHPFFTAEEHDDDTEATSKTDSRSGTPNSLAARLREKTQNQQFASVVALR